MGKILQKFGIKGGREVKGILLLIALGCFSSFTAEAQFFRSKASGNWSDATTWEESASVSGIYSNTVNTPTAVNSSLIQVQSGHTVTVIAPVSIDQTVVATGGTLTISGVALTLANGSGDELTIGGTLNNQGTLAFGSFGTARTTVVTGTFNNQGTITNATSAKLNFQSGSTYNHEFTTTAGVIPGATWNVASTTVIKGYTTNETAPAGLDQTFGNFIWNTPNLATSQGGFDLEGLLGNVQGNFTVQSTNADKLYLNAFATSFMVVGGDFIVNGGALGVNNAGVGTTTIDIGQDLILAGGDFDLTDDSGGVLINLVGDLTNTGGSLASTGTGTSTIAFIGDGANTEQVITNTSAIVGKINFEVSNTIVSFAPTSFINGTGTFTLSNTSTVKIESANGIVNNSGNIRVSGAKNFAAGSTIVLNGTTAQVTGANFPTDVNVQVNNSAGVSLTNDLTIGSTRTLDINAGFISVGAKSLTLSGALTGTGDIRTGTTSTVTLNGSGSIAVLDFGASQIGTLNINRFGNITLTSDLDVATALNFSSGIMLTGSNTVELLSDAVIVETNSSYLTGNLSVTRSVTTAGNNFGGSGLNLVPTTALGQVTAIRQTGVSVNPTAQTTSISRIFDITGSIPGGNNVAMTIAYLPHELNGNDPNALEMYKQPANSAWAQQPGPYTRGTNQVTLSGVTGFSKWTMAEPITVLPVEIASFTAKRKGQAAELNWVTAMEKDNQGFEVEVSEDAKSYQKVAFVASKDPNSRITQRYAFTDNKTLKAGVRYYRLKQIDLDGKVTYYGPKAVTFDGVVATVKIYPNPFQEEVTVQYPAPANEMVTLSVVDALGKKVYEETVTVNQGVNYLPVRVSNDYAKGIYILNVVSESQKLQFKLLKK